MDWEASLISLYLLVCKAYDEKMWVDCQRFTNGGYKKFTDQEVITIYIFGVLSGYRSIKQIHKFTDHHLKNWFPNMPKYHAFAHRVKLLGGAFKCLIELTQANKTSPFDDREYLIDSFPIAIAKGHNAYTSTVSPEFASKSYCSTKKMYYRGAKSHVVARRNPGHLPDLELLVIEEAARQDGPTFREFLRPHMHDNLVFGDMAYIMNDAKEIEVRQDLKVFTPIPRKMGQKELRPDQKVFSKAVSRMRQPIEALFGWINRKTGIEDASLVRSTAGFFAHIFGRFAAAMILKANPSFDF